MMWDRKLLSEFSRLFAYAVFFLGLLFVELLNREFIPYRSTSNLQTALLIGLGFHCFRMIRPSRQMDTLAPFLDQLVLSLIAWNLLSSSSIYIVLTAVNILLCAMQAGPSVAIKLALLAIGFFNFNFLGLESHGVLVADTTKFVFGAGILSSAVFGGGLGVELTQLEAELQVKNRDLSALQDLSDLLIENIGAGVLAVTENGRIARANKGAARIFETVGLVDMDLPDISDPIWGCVRSADRTETYEIEHLNHRGQTMILEVIVSPIKVQAGTERGWVVLVQNRTEIKNLEAELRQREKLAAVGQLAAGIAHEIRNPLASISGSVQLLATTLDTSTPEDKKLLAIVIKEIDRLNDLISEFLDYVRPDADKRERFDLARLVGDIVEMTKGDPKLPKGTQIVVNSPRQLIFLGHHDKIKQALLNIVVNAYQAMEKSATKTLTLSLRPEEHQVVLVVADSGCGIPRDQIRRIFEPFHTTKPKGTGLGLAITHKVIESHDGTIEVHSEVNRGTEFVIKFPVHKV